MKKITIELDPETLTVIALREPDVPPRSMAEARKRLGLSQEVLAELCNITRVYVSMIERGEAENLSLAIAQRIARALHSTVDTLFPDPMKLNNDPQPH